MTPARSGRAWARLGTSRLGTSRLRTSWLGWARLGTALFAAALLYPLTGLFAGIGPWQWTGEVRAAALASVRVSLGLTALAMVVIVALGTPVALYVARCGRRERLLWQALLLIPILLPPLALGILFSLAFGPRGTMGLGLQRFGLAMIPMTNSILAFVATQVYVGMGYYVLGAAAAFGAVPVSLERQAALLGVAPVGVFFRVTLPMAKLGLAVALSVTWIRTLGEFGAVAVTAYYPAGMPVQLWVNLQSFGLPAVMPLLVVFLAVALPLPWLAHVLAERRRNA